MFATMATKFEKAYLPSAWEIDNDEIPGAIHWFECSFQSVEEMICQQSRALYQLTMVRVINGTTYRVWEDASPFKDKILVRPTKYNGKLILQVGVEPIHEMATKVSAYLVSGTVIFERFYATPFNLVAKDLSNDVQRHLFKQQDFSRCVAIELVLAGGDAKQLRGYDKIIDAQLNKRALIPKMRLYMKTNPFALINKFKKRDA